MVRDDDGVSDPPTSWIQVRPPISVFISDQMTMADGGILQLLFEADPWDSLIAFQPGIPVTLDGTLELLFANGTDLASQIGRTLDLFDWTGVSPTGTFAVASPYRWNLTNLYTTGEVTLLPAALGDFVYDGVYNCDDVDALVASIAGWNEPGGV